MLQKLISNTYIDVNFCQRIMNCGTRCYIFFSSALYKCNKLERYEPRTIATFFFQVPSYATHNYLKRKFQIIRRIVHCRILCDDKFLRHYFRYHHPVVFVKSISNTVSEYHNTVNICVKGRPIAKIPFLL
jgi:hypothetical protein